jgi:hypothetical protein
MIATFFLAALTATFHPPKPTVGDLITINFMQPATLDPSPDFEVVSRHGSEVVIRTFKPAPIALSGASGGVHFRNLVVPVRSVLVPNDTLKPAPLAPPRMPPQPLLPLIPIAVALLLAIGGWVTAYRLSRRRHATPIVVLAPAERFRAAVARSAKAKQRWASLADATRAYLAERGFGAELTTSQLLAHLHDDVIADVLSRGDLEKFSPWGAPTGDFEAISAQALELIDRFEPRVTEEAA